MVQEIKLFFMVLSVLYLIKHIGVIGIKLLQSKPNPIKLSIPEIFLLYITISYVITFILS